MIKIYHFRGTRSVRPIWLCHELDLPVDIETVDFSPAFRETPAWRVISPAGKIPAMTDGDLTMIESGAIMEYILDRYGDGRLRPQPGTAESAQYHQWCWFSEATMIRPFGLYRILHSETDDMDTLRAACVRHADDCISAVDKALSDREYLLGSEFSAADIMMGYSLMLLSHLELLDDRYPRAQPYLERLMKRPACTRAMND